MAITLEAIATPENFDESGYLAANPDVAEAVRNGHFRSGRQHFDGPGRKEGRRVRFARSIADIQQEKLKRIAPLLRLDLPHVRRGAKYDFLTEALRAATGIADTNAISTHGYDPYAVELIEACRDGLVLDCGAGKRPVYYPNVVNFEIVDYDTTDVLGVGEALPFRDKAFDAVLSLSVLEHVRDPFACAAEIARVLKPGGKLICCVPFLQPLHGYPHHYYNMTGQGLRALFERRLHIDRHIVPRSTLPLASLTWFVRSWARGLHGEAREQFLSMRMADLLGQPENLQDERWVTELSDATNFELASATMLFAHKEA
jgi:SAM-dependent methyltransferase